MAVGLIVMGLLLAAAGAKILRLQEALAVKPRVENRVVTRTVQGPTRVEVRTITKPGGETIVERIRYTESKTTDKAVEHIEAPVFAPLARPRTRYAGLVIDPLRYAALPRLRAGLTMFKGSVDLGVSYDWRFPATAGAFGLETAWRF